MRSNDDGTNICDRRKKDDGVAINAVKNDELVANDGYELEAHEHAGGKNAK
jgi:hypothetical protein